MANATMTEMVRRARKYDEPWMLCEMDYEDTKRNFLRPLSYSQEDEFIAFDGRILAIGYQDGTVEA